MNNSILPFWKPIGTSSSIIAKRVAEKLNCKTSHTGTLDPLAEGVIVVIAGESSANKEKYISEFKTYEFSLIFGFSTDTHDALGIIEKVNSEEIFLIEEQVKEKLSTFIGSYKQKYPEFSSKKVLGKSLWEYKRLGLSVPEVFIEGTIKEIDVLAFSEISSINVLNHIKSQINLIKGNFRQEEILKKYSETSFPEKFYEMKVRVCMSRGLYVRGLARDLSEKLNSNCIILDLVRVKDGEIEKKDCLNVNEYFKEEILKDQNFLFPEFKKL